VTDLAARPVLDVRNLRTSFFTPDGELKAVDDVSFSVHPGEVVAIVGESGSGKSITQMSVMGLLPMPPGRILGGTATFEGRHILGLNPRSAEMRAVRGAGIAMIFQEPMSSLNPVLTIGQQLSEVIRVHQKIGRRAAWARGIAALEAVGIPEASRRMKAYPFELSGGMRQRVMIATAVACTSRLIIADEPTTALDVTTQAQVMELLVSLVAGTDRGLLVITHNLGLVSRYADRVYVMYAGRIVETGTTEQVLTAPQHPYAIGLLAATPSLDGDPAHDLTAIDGAPPHLIALPEGCAFRPRCRLAVPACGQGAPPDLRASGGPGQMAACHLRGETRASA
jgi:oligopeptide/dipeptide ABC transporter ATP-binding protein